MELFKLLGTIAIDNSEANASIDDTTDKASKSESKISGAFGKVGSAALKVGKVVATGLVAGATAIAALTASATSAYADYEQLVGGVETLFGAQSMSLEEYAESVGKTTDEIEDEYNGLIRAQESVLDNAKNAYKSAGMSMNEYMETVTSFSSSLISSLGGDTEAAAQKADRAIIDMADNANKMGSSIESIQNAYQGFAKQNYTMLDNLKLGYGGTKEEMARLIEDASKMKDVQEELGVTVDANSMSFANIVDAISVVQKSMGIMDATANEAATTITGSVSAMKAAWSNLVTGLGDDQANLDELINQFVESVVVAGENIIPRIEIILNGILQMVTQLIPVIAEKLPSLIETLLPSLVEGAVALFNGLVAALPAILQILIEQIPFIVTQIGQALITAFPVLLETVQQLFGQIFDYISLELLNTGVSFNDTFAVMQEGFALVWDYMQTYWENIGKPIWDMISFAVTEVKNVFAALMPEITAFVQNAFAGIKDTWEHHLKPTYEAIGNFMNNVLKPAFEFVFSTIIEPLITNVFGTIKRLWEGTLKPVFDGICDFLTGVFTLNWEKALNGILSIVTGVFKGIVTAIETPMNLAKDIVNKAIEKIKETFDFDWKFPELKLPHFKISGSFSINPPSVPSFGIEWYKDGGIMTDPTMFGFNPVTGKAMVGGEAGAEAIAPIDVLQGYVAQAVASQNAGLVDVLYKILDAILSMDENMGGNLREALAGTSFEVDNREFARLVKAVN